MVHQCDQSIVDEFLANISNLGDAFDAEKLKWQDVCMNLPGVLYNMMVAWENDTVSAAEVKGILDFLKLRLCSYSVCTAAWICSYIQMIPDDELLKPMNMVQQLSTPITAEDLASSENLKERMGLTAQILRKMQIDVHQNNKIRSAYYSNAIVLQTPLEEHFADVWKSITELGWMPIESTQGMDGILFSSGPYWLTTNLVNQILQCKYAKVSFSLFFFSKFFFLIILLSFFSGYEQNNGPCVCCYAFKPRSMHIDSYIRYTSIDCTQ